MSEVKKTFNEVRLGDTWQQKVFAADRIWAQVKTWLEATGMTLPGTPRRPDVRMIVDNVSGAEMRFMNPGNHSADREEVIPAAGDQKAVMIMLKGATLDEQHANAAKLYETYDLGEKGLSFAFVDALRAGKLSAQIDEAYGPAPFQGQTAKLVDLDWKTAGDGASVVIAPVKGAHAAHGARAAVNETAFRIEMDIHVKGTTTTAEKMENGQGMVVAVSEDWDTKKVTTRPIVPSVARVYYGAYFSSMPVVKIDSSGDVCKIDGIADAAGQRRSLTKTASIKIEMSQQNLSPS